MKVRKILNGDYCMGHGGKEFLTNTPQAVAQCVMTRLALWSGTWFADTGAGTPWLGDVLGKSSAADAVIKQRILETNGVRKIVDFEAIFNPDNRKLTITAKLETDYGEAVLNGVLGQ